MKLIESDLILEEFFIVNSNYAFIEPNEDLTDIKDLMRDYSLDIDFVVRDVKNEDNKYLIFAKVEINDNENPVPGYTIFAEGISIFRFNESATLSERDRSEFLWTSGVSISINNLRNYISTKTSYYPLGKYTLPSVDLTRLLNTKRELMNEQKKKSDKKNDV
ncbi:hypothetical protein [Flagellimonas amoyensis]|uniref:hypothetical protein n=1 Tax=Flagellimonas amoyensis TaxID=2169401 RepID=UPI000D38FCD8|nr:hypothetical protein [Allomuricauda amoyensis]